MFTIGSNFSSKPQNVETAGSIAFSKPAPKAFINVETAGSIACSSTSSSSGSCGSSFSVAA